MDEIDKRIITLLQEDPNISHTRIAKFVNRSQPAVGSRISKLRKSGHIRLVYGFDLARVNMVVAQVRFTFKYPSLIADFIDEIPNIVSIFKLSGKRNVCALVVAKDLRELDKLVESEFRDRKSIQNLKMELVTDFPYKFVTPVRIERLSPTKNLPKIQKTRPESELVNPLVKDLTVSF
ncbi:MAG: Lrp/AsnC family transcriptional regulator [Promethearchaeota archaeon]